MAKKPKDQEDGNEKGKTITPSEQLNNLLKQNKEDHFNFEERVYWKISSGSILLDVATNGITPSLVRICGNNNGGKTPQALEIIRNFLKDVPNSRCLWILSEGRLSEENRARCGLKFVTKAEDWVDGSIFLLESNIHELAIRVIKDLVLNNPEKKIYGFVIDSVDGLISKNDISKDAEDSAKVAGSALLSKKMLQSLSVGMFKYGHLMIMISQVTSEIKLDPYQKTANRGGGFSGGNALLHWADVILEVSPSYQGDFILDSAGGKMNDGKTQVIGRWCKVTLQKSTTEKSIKQVISYPIKYGKRPSGIWTEYEVGDLLLSFEYVEKKGAGWMTLKESLINEIKHLAPEIPEKIQGMDNLYDFLEKNPKVTEYLVSKFKNSLN